MTTMAVRLDRLQAGIIAWLEAVQPDATVSWSPSGFPSEGGNSLALTARMRTGPDDEVLGGASVSTARLPLTATLHVLAGVEDSGAEGLGVGLAVSGRVFQTTILAGATIETVRDALLAAISSDPLVSATFTAVDPDPDDILDTSLPRIAIAALELGDLYAFSAMQSIPGLVSLEVLTSQVAKVRTTDVRSTIEVQAWARVEYPRAGAHAALAAVKGSIGLPTASEILDDYTLAFTGGAPGKILALDGMTGPRWASRAVFSLYVSQLSLTAEPAGLIERVQTGVIVRDAPGEVELEFEAEPDP